MSKHALKVPNFTPDEVRSEPRLQNGLVLTGLSRLLLEISLLKFFRSFPMGVITLMTVHHSHSVGWPQGCAQHLPNSAVVTDLLLQEKRSYFPWNRICPPQDTSASSLQGSHEWNKISIHKDAMGHSGENQMYPLSQGLDEPLVPLALLIKFCGPFITVMLLLLLSRFSRVRLYATL